MSRADMEAGARAALEAAGVKINARGVADHLLAIADGVLLAGGAEKMIRLAADGLLSQDKEIKRLAAIVAGVGEDAEKAALRARVAELEQERLHQAAGR